MTRRLLIIDDDDTVRQIAQASLQIVGGHEVLVAKDGMGGLELAEAEWPDAILLDVMMPDLDGPEVLARLRLADATRNIPVVFMTAKTRQSQLDELASTGATGVISKPFDAMELPAQLAAILGWDAP